MQLRRIHFGKGDTGLVGATTIPFSLVTLVAARVNDTATRRLLLGVIGASYSGFTLPYYGLTTPGHVRLL